MPSMSRRFGAALAAAFVRLVAVDFVIVSVGIVPAVFVEIVLVPLLPVFAVVIVVAVVVVVGVRLFLVVAERGGREMDRTCLLFLAK